MDNQYFVYAIDNGTISREDGIPILIFGYSSLKAIHNRFQAYNSTSPIHPILLGVIPCENKRHALDVEKAVLQHTASDCFPEKPNAEVRKASDAVLAFIETEMEDGETFLGMSLYDFVRKSENQYRSQLVKDPDRKSRKLKRQREWVRDLYQNDPKFREKERKRARDRQRELWKDPEYRKRQNELSRERMKDPVNRQKKRDADRRWRQRQNHGGNNPNQQKLF